MIESDTAENIVVAVYKTGPQKAYKITLANGKSIVCSGNHIFPVGGVGDSSINTGMGVGMYLQVKGQ